MCTSRTGRISKLGVFNSRTNPQDWRHLSKAVNNPEIRMVQSVHTQSVEVIIIKIEPFLPLSRPGICSIIFDISGFRWILVTPLYHYSQLDTNWLLAQLNFTIWLGGMNNINTVSFPLSLFPQTQVFQIYMSVPPWVLSCLLVEGPPDC